MTDATQRQRDVDHATKITNQLKEIGVADLSMKLVSYQDLQRSSTTTGNLTEYGENITDVRLMKKSGGKWMPSYVLGQDNLDPKCVLMPAKDMLYVTSDPDGSNMRTKNDDGSDVSAFSLMQNFGKLAGHKGFDRDTDLSTDRDQKLWYSCSAQFFEMPPGAEQLDFAVFADSYQPGKAALVVGTSIGVSCDTSHKDASQHGNLQQLGITRVVNGQDNLYCIASDATDRTVAKSGTETKAQAIEALKAGKVPETAHHGPRGAKKCAVVSLLQIPLQAPEPTPMFVAPKYIAPTINFDKFQLSFDETNFYYVVSSPRSDGAHVLRYVISPLYYCNHVYHYATINFVKGPCVLTILNYKSHTLPRSRLDASILPLQHPMWLMALLPAAQHLIAQQDQMLKDAIARDLANNAFSRKFSGRSGLHSGARYRSLVINDDDDDDEADESDDSDDTDAVAFAPLQNLTVNFTPPPPQFQQQPKTEPTDAEPFELVDNDVAPPTTRSLVEPPPEPSVSCTMGRAYRGAYVGPARRAQFTHPKPNERVPAKVEEILFVTFPNGTAPTIEDVKQVALLIQERTAAAEACAGRGAEKLSSKFAAMVGTTTVGLSAASAASIAKKQAMTPPPPTNFEQLLDDIFGEEME